ncbi:unnamed protein product [Symbiodinium pilosum]|uniref:C3H1-type domain-containing protein n=1 Tax=Symbiodinium pilosum TaxID=2952 RepID=A0A812YJZ9_SYMPI|nr:unnamed protein product [Symbiodinium pilosum]
MDFEKLTKKVSNFHKSLMVYNWYFPKEDKTALFLVIHFDLEHAEFDAIFRAAKDFFGQKHQDSVTTYVNWSAGSGTQNNVLECWASCLQSTVCQIAPDVQATDRLWFGGPGTAKEIEEDPPEDRFPLYVLKKPCDEASSSKEEWRTKTKTSKHRFVRQSEQDEQNQALASKPCPWGQFCFDGSRCRRLHSEEERAFFREHGGQPPFKVNPKKAESSFIVCDQKHHYDDVDHWRRQCNFLHKGEEPTFCQACRSAPCRCDEGEGDLIQPNDLQCQWLKDSWVEPCTVYSIQDRNCSQSWSPQAR